MLLPLYELCYQFVLALHVQYKLLYMDHMFYSSLVSFYSIN